MSGVNSASEGSEKMDTVVSKIKALMDAAMVSADGNAPSTVNAASLVASQLTDDDVRALSSVGAMQMLETAVAATFAPRRVLEFLTGFCAGLANRLSPSLKPGVTFEPMDPWGDARSKLEQALASRRSPNKGTP